MTAAERVYDFEGQMYAALALVFDDLEAKVWTPNDAPKVTRPRPRTEAIYSVGAEKQSYIVFSNGTKRNASWFSNLSFEMVTDAGNIDAHRAYRGFVRNLLAPNITLLNGASTKTGAQLLPYHRIQLIRETGTSNEYKNEDGYLRSRINYDVEFGIDHGVWLGELGLTPIN